MSIRIQINGLTKRFGSQVALSDFTLDTGTNWGCLGLVGRNGAGKTTLLRILAGLLEPSVGELSLSLGSRQASCFDPSQALFLAEYPCLPEAFNGHHYLTLMAQLNQLVHIQTDRVLRDGLVQDLALAEQLDKPIHTLSKGTRRKLELASALSCQIPLVIVDELNDGLDIPSMAHIAKLIRQSCARGQRFIISSHDLAFICTIADQLIVVDHGRCIDHFERHPEFEANQTRILAAFPELEACR